MSTFQEFLIALAKTIVIFGTVVQVAALMTLAERRFSAWMQYRIGPNRVGPFGLLQPLADGVKFIFKEELVPDGANRWLFRAAPVIAALPAMMTIAVIPFAPDIIIGNHNFGTFAVAELDVGILYILALGGISIYGVILGGWASNSKYSLLGALRASAQMISYELTLILTILAVVVMSGSLNLRTIVESQPNLIDWHVFSQPLAFIMFVIATFAETNRHPFDFSECEPELVGGFHTEYSAMKWAMFYIGEYSAMTMMSALTCVLFLGGWSVPFWPDAPWYVCLASMLAKTGFFLFLFLWVRWTLPRFRFDQLMRIGWKVFLPLSLLNLLVTGLFKSMGWDLWSYLPW